MKLKSLTLILALALSAQVAFAQQSKTDSSVEFRPHWYGQIMGGGAYTVGETAFKDLLSPAAAVNVGWQFNPALGLRLGVGGWQGKGNALGPTEVYKFNFLQGNLDLKVDLGNLLAGYNHKRFFNPYLLVGGGAAYGLKNGVKAGVKTSTTPFEYLWEDGKLITPVGRFGLGTDLRLTEGLALTLEANGNVLSDRFNSKKAGNPDYQYNLLAGLKFAFGKTTRPSAKYLADLAAAEAAAAALQAQKEAERLAAEKAAAEKAAAEKAAAEKAAAEAAAAAAKADLDKYATLNTFFELDSDVISDEEAAKLVDFIQWLNKYNRSVDICGYADVQTGRPKYNMGLSSRRVEKVKAFLVEHGVDASRISTDYKGDTVQPFAENDLNRVVISTVVK